MKKFFLLSIVLITLFKNGFPQCYPLPPNDTPNLWPAPPYLYCIHRGEPYFNIVHFESFDSAGAVAITSTIIDSITNLPAGILYSIVPGGWIPGGSTACIAFSGSSSDPAGNYALEIYVTIIIGGIDTISQKLNEVEYEMISRGIVDSSNYTPVFNTPYYLRVMEPGAYCPIDETGIRAQELVQSNLFPNPTSGTFTLLLSRNIADFELQVLDISGKMVQSHLNLSGEKITLDSKGLDNGIYLYRVIAEGKAVTQGKLVVVR